jgi:hypothetical protein
MMSAMICPELPQVQRAAMRMNVKLPLVYNKVLIRDIRAITVNRWSHGYSYSSALTLGDDPDELPRYRDEFRKRAGNIAVAGADAGWNASIEVATDEAARAVDELTAIAA